MKITLKSGRAHVKHTEGGDFRQSVYRAVRQGLMQAHSVLLEPFYAFHLTIPDKMVGRAMTDLERRFAVFEGPGAGGRAGNINWTCPGIGTRWISDGGDGRTRADWDR